MAISKIIFNNEVQMDTTGVTVDSSTLLNPYTALDSTGELITGNITYNTVTGGTKTPTTSNQTLANAGWNYLSSNLVMAGSSNLTAANIKRGISLFGVTGTCPTYTQLYSGSATVSTTSTSAAQQTTITASNSYSSDYIVVVQIRDNAGPRNGYFLGSDTYFFNYYDANNATTTLTYGAHVIHSVDSSGNYYMYTTGTTTGYGVYAYSITSAGVVAIYRRYNSTYSKTINGTYNIRVFRLDYAPTKGDPFNL